MAGNHTNAGPARRSGRAGVKEDVVAGWVTGAALAPGQTLTRWSMVGVCYWRVGLTSRVTSAKAATGQPRGEASWPGDCG